MNLYRYFVGARRRRRGAIVTATASDDDDGDGVLFRREGPARPPDRPPPVSGAALRAFDALEATLPGMKSAITRVQPVLTAILDGAIDDRFDDRQLLRDLRLLAHQAQTVRVACNQLGAGVDLLESELEVL